VHDELWGEAARHANDVMNREIFFWTVLQARYYIPCIDQERNRYSTGIATSANRIASFVNSIKYECSHFQAKMYLCLQGSTDSADRIV
jgi:hypothetical protein